MFAVWLKFACALLCAIALPLSGAATGDARADATERAAGETWSAAAKSGAVLGTCARGGSGCPLAAAAKPAPTRPLPVFFQSMRVSGEPKLDVARPVARRAQAASPETRSRSGVVRLLI